MLRPGILRNCWKPNIRHTVRVNELRIADQQILACNCAVHAEDKSYGHFPMQSSDIDISSSRVLIADDIQQNRELLEAYLADEGYEILMAADGHQTMQMVEQHQPDLILLDIMMPRMSGYEVCSQIKSDPGKRMIPVLMVTALNEPGDIEKAVNAGCDDFLTKPVNRLELRTRVRSLLRVRHLASERDRLLAYLEEMEHRVLRSAD